MILNGWVSFEFDGWLICVDISGEICGDGFVVLFLGDGDIIVDVVILNV